MPAETRATEGVDPPAAPIVQYWHREVIPEDVVELLATFDDHNPGWRHLVYSASRAEELIAERFSTRELAAFRACAAPAMQSDYLRLCAVLVHGGVYADADACCLAPLDSLLEASEGGTLFGWGRMPERFRTPAFEWRERVGPYRALPNSLFAFRSPDHLLLALALEIATVGIEERIADDVALATGPAIFTCLYLVRELGSLDAYLDYARGGALEPLAPLHCKVIGDFERVERAFAGVRVRPAADSGEWIGPPPVAPAYKRTEDYWLNSKASIFR